MYDIYWTTGDSEKNLSYSEVLEIVDGLNYKWDGDKVKGGSCVWHDSSARFGPIGAS